MSEISYAASPSGDCDTSFSGGLRRPLNSHFMGSRHHGSVRERPLRIDSASCRTFLIHASHIVLMPLCDWAYRQRAWTAGSSPAQRTVTWLLRHGGTRRILRIRINLRTRMIHSEMGQSRGILQWRRMLQPVTAGCMGGSRHADTQQNQQKNGERATSQHQHRLRDDRINC